MIKPILKFQAVVEGTPEYPYPHTFTPDDEFKPDSEEAAAALATGSLSDDDRSTVQKALEAKAKADAKAAAAEKKAAEKKADSASPENKSDGAAG